MNIVNGRCWCLERNRANGAREYHYGTASRWRAHLRWLLHELWRRDA